jgi:hypothetical protein
MRIKLINPKCKCLKWWKTIFDNSFTILEKYSLQVPVEPSKLFSCKRIMTWITPYTGSEYEDYKSNLTLELYKIILNDQWKDQKYLNKSWGACRDLKRLSMSCNDDDNDAQNQINK